MGDFKFISNKQRDKIKLFNNHGILNELMMAKNFRAELIGNNQVTVDGCLGVIEYKNEYIKIKLKKGNVAFCGRTFEITYFENGTIVIKGIINSIEFCI